MLSATEADIDEVGSVILTIDDSLLGFELDKDMFSGSQISI